MPKPPNRPTGVNQLAKPVVDLAAAAALPMPVPPDASDPALAAFGREAGARQIVLLGKNGHVVRGRGIAPEMLEGVGYRGERLRHRRRDPAATQDGPIGAAAERLRRRGGERSY